MLKIWANCQLKLIKVCQGVGVGEAHTPEIMHCAAFSIRLGKNQGPGLQFRCQYNILHTLLKRSSNLSPL